MNIKPVSGLKQDIYNGFVMDKNMPTMKQKISFKGKPWVLNLDILHRCRNNSLSGDEAISIYKDLKLGNYLDIDGNINNFENKCIRE